MRLKTTSESEPSAACSTRRQGHRRYFHPLSLKLTAVSHEGAQLSPGLLRKGHVLPHTVKRAPRNPWGHAESCPNGHRGTSQTKATRPPKESPTKPEKLWTLPGQAPSAPHPTRMLEVSLDVLGKSTPKISANSSEYAAALTQGHTGVPPSGWASAEAPSLLRSPPLRGWSPPKTVTSRHVGNVPSASPWSSDNPGHTPRVCVTHLQECYSLNLKGLPPSLPGKPVFVFPTEPLAVTKIHIASSTDAALPVSAPLQAEWSHD